MALKKGLFLLEEFLNNTNEKKIMAHKEKTSNEIKQLQTSIASISPLETLNEEQFSSATSKHQNNLVIASAGTGKTSTIIARVYFLIKEKNIPPENIVLLTFTNKAGKEMLQRLLRYFDNSIVSKLFAGTFHAYGKRLLNLDGKKKSKLMKEADITNIVTTIYFNLFKEYNLDYSKCIAPSSLVTKYFYYRNVSSRNDKDGFLKHLIEDEIDAEYADFYSNVMQRYKLDKEKYSLIDFTDYIDNIIYYYNNNKSNINEIIVDEYQDTNYLQNNALLSMIKAGDTSLFCVGDFDQSIYAFNGSDINIIKNMPNIYDNVHVHFLNKNYRSTKAILDVANNVIKRNTRIFDKELFAMTRGIGEEPEVYQFEDLASEETFIVDDIKRSSYDINDIAILYRSNGSGDSIELALLEQDVMVNRTDKQDFMQSFQMQFFLSFLKLKNHPNIVDFHNIANVLSKHEIKYLYDIIIKEGKGDFYGGITTTLLNILKEDRSKNEKLKLLLDLIKQLKSFSSPKIIFNCILNSSFFTKYMEFNDEADEIRFSDKMINAIKTLFYNAKDIKSLLLRENFSKEEDDKCGVKLMTVHSSKGLEFKKVFVINLSANKFPSKRLATSIEEERRLMYVAITRAKEVLTLTYSFKKKDNKPSPFIKETKCSVNY